MDGGAGATAHELIDPAMGALDKRAAKRNTPKFGSKSPASTPPACSISTFKGEDYGQSSEEEGQEGSEKEGRQTQIRQEDGEAEGREAQGSATARRQAEGRKEEGCQEEGSHQKGDRQEGGREKGSGAQARSGSQAGARTGTEARDGCTETGTGTEAGARAGPVADEPRPGRAQAGDVFGLGASAQAGPRQAPMRGEGKTIERND